MHTYLKFAIKLVRFRVGTICNMFETLKLKSKNWKTRFGWIRSKTAFVRKF